MKFNKLIADLDLDHNVKKYVNNYINESINLMFTQGHIEEFIWTKSVSYEYDLHVLLTNNIITYGYMSDGILIPTESPGLHFPNIFMMLHDDVLLENGFKLPFIKEEKDV